MRGCCKVSSWLIDSVYFHHGQGHHLLCSHFPFPPGGAGFDKRDIATSGSAGNIHVSMGGKHQSLQCLHLGSDNEQGRVLSAVRIVGAVLERDVWWLCLPGGL